LAEKCNDVDRIDTSGGVWYPERGRRNFIAEVWYIYRDQCNGGCLSLNALCGGNWY